MACGDSAAVHVHLAFIPAELLAHRQRTGGKGLVASMRSTSSSVQPARDSAVRQALTGPMPITDGSTPVTA